MQAYKFSLEFLLLLYTVQKSINSHKYSLLSQDTSLTRATGDALHGAPVSPFIESTSASSDDTNGHDTSNVSSTNGGLIKSHKFSFPGSNILLPFSKPLIFHKRRRHHSTHQTGGNDFHQPESNTNELERITVDDLVRLEQAELLKNNDHYVNELIANGSSGTVSFQCGDENGYTGLEDDANQLAPC